VLPDLPQGKAWNLSFCPSMMAALFCSTKADWLLSCQQLQVTKQFLASPSHVWVSCGSFFPFEEKLEASDLSAGAKSPQSEAWKEPVVPRERLTQRMQPLTNLPPSPW